MKEECIICKAPLIYLEKDEMMECVLCHKKELSKTRCEQGHYVCNECHTKGMGVIIDICLSETSKNPIEIIRRMMAQPFCHMHGPEHHVNIFNFGSDFTAGKFFYQQGSFFQRINRIVRVDTTFETERRVGAQSVTAGSLTYPCRMEISAFQKYVFCRFGCS